MLGARVGHGFGAYCRGWELGRTPWCYVDNCSLVESTGSSARARRVRLERLVAAAAAAEPAEPAAAANPPDPPPPPPSPPPPPPPPPKPWVESSEGWARPTRARAGVLEQARLGACKGWELEGQTPWCYVTPECDVPMNGGSFGKHFIECTKKPAGGLGSLFGRMLKGRRLKKADPTPLTLAKEKAKKDEKEKKAATKTKATKAKAPPKPVSQMGSGKVHRASTKKGRSCRRRRVLRRSSAPRGSARAPCARLRPDARLRPRRAAAAQQELYLTADSASSRPRGLRAVAARQGLDLLDGHCRSSTSAASPRRPRRAGRGDDGGVHRDADDAQASRDAEGGTGGHRKLLLQPTPSAEWRVVTVKK